MNTGTVAARYARALFEYALEKGQDGAVYAEMTALGQCLSHVREMHERLSDPTVSDSAKQKLLETAVTGTDSAPSESTVRFIALILKRQRQDMLLFMTQSYMDRYRRHYGIVPVSLVTAMPCSPEHKARFEKLVRQVSDGTPEWNCSVDPTIEGGYILTVDGYRMDASVASQLEYIRKELIEKNNRVI